MKYENIHHNMAKHGMQHIIDCDRNVKIVNSQKHHRRVAVCLLLAIWRRWGFLGFFFLFFFFFFGGGGGLWGAHFTLCSILVFLLCQHKCLESIKPPKISSIYSRAPFSLPVKGAHRDFSTTSHSAQFHTQVKLQHRRFALVKLQRSTFAASMQKQLPKSLLTKIKT